MMMLLCLQYIYISFLICFQTFGCNLFEIAEFQFAFFVGLCFIAHYQTKIQYNHSVESNDHLLHFCALSYPTRLDLLDSLDPTFHVSFRAFA